MPAKAIAHAWRNRFDPLPEALSAIIRDDEMKETRPQGLQVLLERKLDRCSRSSDLIGRWRTSLMDVCDSQVTARSWRVIVRALGRVGTYSCNACSHPAVACCIGGQVQTTKRGFEVLTRRITETRCVSHYLSFIRHLISRIHCLSSHIPDLISFLH